MTTGTPQGLLILTWHGFQVRALLINDESTGKMPVPRQN
jgi:hypothetical protein